MSNYQKSAPLKQGTESPEPHKSPEPSRTQPTRRPLDAPKPSNRQDPKQNSYPTKTINQKQLDSSCYRLSRVPHKFTTAKVNKAEQGNFAEQYYNSPDNEIDIRPPEEKLKDVDAKLGDENAEIESDERFDLLIQQKQLRILVYGENSPEVIQSMTAIGSFYNSQGFYTSANRNLSKAQSSAKNTKLSEEDQFKLNLELTDVALHSSSQNKSEQQKKLSEADKLLSPYAETETSDPKLAYRRDLYIADIHSQKKRYEESLPFYERAGDNFPQANPEKTKEMAEIYVRGAQAANQAQNTEKEIEFYKKAIAVYQELQMDAEAQKLQEKLPAEPAEGENAEGQENPDQAQENQPKQDGSAPPPAQNANTSQGLGLKQQIEARVDDEIDNKPAPQA